MAAPHARVEQRRQHGSSGVWLRVPMETYSDLARARAAMGDFQFSTACLAHLSLSLPVRLSLNLWSDEFEPAELLFHAMVRCEQQHDVGGAAVGTELGIN